MAAELVTIPLRDVGAVQADDPGLRLQYAQHEAQQSCLAGRARADDSQAFSWRQPQTDAADEGSSSWCQGVHHALHIQLTLRGGQLHTRRAMAHDAATQALPG